MDRKLLCEIVQRIECVAGIESFLVLAVAALPLAVVPRGIRANQLMPDAQLSSRPLKQLGLCVLVGVAVGPPGLAGPYHSGALLLRTSLEKTAILHLCFGTEKNRRLDSKKPDIFGLFAGGIFFVSTLWQITLTLIEFQEGVQ